MKKEGVPLGEMQAKLLSKVEELTLYLIDQNKRIEALENTNNQLMAKISDYDKKVQREKNQ